MTTAMGGSQAARIHLTRLKSPEAIQAIQTDRTRANWSMTTTDISVSMRSPYGNTFWASSARPHLTSNDFALGTSEGTILVGHSQGTYSFESMQKFGSWTTEGYVSTGIIHPYMLCD